MNVNITTVSLKNCIGKEVFDHAGNKLGSLQDFLINTIKSYAAFAVVSEGGSFNPAIEELYIVLPLNALQLENPEAKQVSLNIAAKRLDEIPKISKAQFINRDENFFKEIEDFYGAKQNFTKPLAISENETENHQSYEGSAESSENESIDYNSLGDEVDYDRIKGIDKNANRQDL